MSVKGDRVVLRDEWICYVPRKVTGEPDSGYCAPEQGSMQKKKGQKTCSILRPFLVAKAGPSQY